MSFRYLLAFTFCCVLWFFGVKASDEPALVHLKGLHAHWMENRSELCRASLRERASLQNKMNATEQKIIEQSKLLGLESRENCTSVNPDISNPNRVEWIPESRSIDIVELEKQNLSNPWVANWGKSLYARRNTPSESSQSLPEEYKNVGDLSENTARHQPPLDWPLEA